MYTDRKYPTMSSFLDRDFRQLVHGILDAVKLARTPETMDASDTTISSEVEAEVEEPAEVQMDQPFTSQSFNLILTTATIPSALNTHLLVNFPDLVRLTSPKLHKLPRKLTTERVDIKGMGNPNAAMHKKLVEIFADQERRARLPTSSVSNASKGHEGGAKVILFCNQTKKAEEIGEYLTGMKMANLVMTGSSKDRRKGSNNHLEAFLSAKKGTSASSRSTLGPQPRVLVTTSLLARGLDFSPSVSHVLIVDEPRNEVDFLHRAGRTGRAGRAGTVVVFGKGIAPKKARKPGFA